MTKDVNVLQRKKDDRDRKGGGGRGLGDRKLSLNMITR